MGDEKETDAEKAERHEQELQVRLKMAKVCSAEEFDAMVQCEHFFVDRIALLKARASALFQQGFLEVAASAYTRAIGMHACQGEPASHALYGNRSACRCGFGDYDGALTDADECIKLNPTWAKGYVRKGAALHGLYKLDEAVRAYERGLTYDPSLTALTDGLNDALRRRKAMGGTWQEELVPSTVAKQLLLAARKSAQTAFDESGRPGAPVDGGEPISVSAYGDCIAVADASSYSVSLYSRDGVLLRCIGERASKFATARRPGVFVRPPGHVALADGHLFVLEAGGTSHVHVLDPASGEPKGLLQPPFNVLPAHASSSVSRARVAQKERSPAAAGDVGEETTLGPAGCIIGMYVNDEGLVVLSDCHGAVPSGPHLKLLRLPRSQAAAADSPGAAVDAAEGAAMGADAAKPGKEELSYKKGFLLEIS